MRTPMPKPYEFMVTVWPASTDDDPENSFAEVTLEVNGHLVSSCVVWWGNAADAQYRMICEAARKC